MKRLFLITIILSFSATAYTHAGKPPLSAKEGLARLMDGNRRFAEDFIKAPHRSTADRDIVAQGQHPFAIIVSCSDSRVPPEILFDQGLGDLFVTRTAGAIVSAFDIGSVEYAVLHFATPLVVVLGHSHCGAVKACLEGGEAPGHIAEIVGDIQPAVTKAKTIPGDPLNNAITQNVRRVTQQLANSHPILAERVRHKKLKIVGGVYDLKTGRVTLLDH